MSNGHFVWFELMTRGVGIAQQFYGQLLNWNVGLTDAGSATYPSLRVGDDAFGGLVRLTGRGETASHWLAYVAVADVDATAERAVSLGGSIEREPSSPPGGGRYAHLRDPHGALFGVASGGPAQQIPPPNQTPFTRFGFFELWTPDPQASMAFYGELFGWERGKSIELGPPGTYQVARVGGAEAIGFMPWPTGFHGRIAWVPYAHVSRVDPIITKIKELGGTVHVPPEDLPGMGRFSIVEDSTGATFALYNVL